MTTGTLSLLLVTRHGISENAGKNKKIVLHAVGGHSHCSIYLNKSKHPAKFSGTNIWAAKITWRIRTNALFELARKPWAPRKICDSQVMALFLQCWIGRGKGDGKM